MYTTLDTKPYLTKTSSGFTLGLGTESLERGRLSVLRVFSIKGLLHIYQGEKHQKVGCIVLTTHQATGCCLRLWHTILGSC